MSKEGKYFIWGAFSILIGEGISVMLIRWALLAPAHFTLYPIGK